MNWHNKTVDTYDSKAKELAEKFKGIGARTDDILRAIELSKSSGNTHVVEIGWDDGRDASEIVPRVASYIGVDPSAGLLELARRRLPKANFVQADALSFDYPAGVDVIFAFASLLHINKSDLQEALQKAWQSLRTGGIYYISLKERDNYSEVI